MFDRVRIKELAKNALKRRYWIVVLVCILVGLLGGSLADGLTAGDGLNLSANMDLSESSLHLDADDDQGIVIPPEDDGALWGGENPWDQYAYGTPQESFSIPALWAEMQETLRDLMDEIGVSLSFIIGVFVLLLSVAIVCGVLFTVLVSNVMTVSGHGWMLRHWRGEEVTVGEAFAAFRIYKPTVVTMLVRGIYVWLWSLLFVIPGIVKGYAYSMVPYIIYENPNLTANEAIKISNKMTKGYKFELFVLGLSFIGWKFLSAITGGLVGILWSNPYMGLTHAGVYEDLKWRAIQNGTLTWDDFGQTPPPPADPFGDMWGNNTQQPLWEEPAAPSSWAPPAPQTPWDTPMPQAPADPTPPMWHSPTDTP